MFWAGQRANGFGKERCAKLVYGTNFLFQCCRLVLTIAKVVLFRILFPVLGINIRVAFLGADNVQQDSQIRRSKTLKKD